MIPVELALSALWRNWRMIVGGSVVAVMILLLVLAKADARRWHKVADQNAALYQLETAKHAVTRASLNTAIAALDDQSRSVRALADASAARTSAADAGRKAAEKDGQRREAAARALDASAATARAGEPCAPSDVFWGSVRKDL